MDDKAKNIHTENSEELPDIDHFIKKLIHYLNLFLIELNLLDIKKEPQ